MPSHLKLKSIVTGGQTGVDIAAVKAAVEYGIPYYGWVPKGYRNETESIDPYLRSGFFESDSESFESRTERNVIIGEATLVLFEKDKDEGTILTKSFSEKHKKKYREIDIRGQETIDVAYEISEWLTNEQIEILNVAGPRESNSPQIEQRAQEIFRILFSLIQQPSGNFFEIAKLSHERFLNNFRHWDIIRWLIPAWFITLLVGAGICQITLCSSEAYQSLSCCHKFFVQVAVTSFVLIFAVIFQVLLCRLKTYHIREWNDFQDTIMNLPLGKTEKTVLTRKLPFSFDDKGYIKTATFWFTVLIWACVALWVVVGLGTLHISSHQTIGVQNCDSPETALCGSPDNGDCPDSDIGKGDVKSLEE